LMRWLKKLGSGLNSEGKEGQRQNKNKSVPFFENKSVPFLSVPFLLF